MRFLRRNGRGRDTGPELRLFFATDIHGSERCWRKFLNAGQFYGVRHLVMGGDIVGKVLVPVERVRSGWTISFAGNEYRDLTDHERDEIEQIIRDQGQYPVRGERDELEALADESHCEEAFKAIAVESIRRWVDLAEERLGGTDIRCYVAPGNDDPFEIDQALLESSVEFTEGRYVSMEEGYGMIVTGYSNPTPWDSPREISEDELGERLQEMYLRADGPERLICVAHPPPCGTELDQAPQLDEDLRVQTAGGAPLMTSVGSSAVREFIERTQPLLGLHGHVHESKATTRLGRTVCVNPGSEYGDGTLLGALVTLRKGEAPSVQMVTG